MRRVDSQGHVRESVGFTPGSGLDSRVVIPAVPDPKRILTFGPYNSQLVETLGSGDVTVDETNLVTVRSILPSDLSTAGAQPMHDKQNTVVICFNGEIYNHEALKKELEACGHEYFSKTDTETLIYAYKEWGINFIHKLEGMFAFSLFAQLFAFLGMLLFFCLLSHCGLTF